MRKAPVFQFERHPSFRIQHDRNTLDAFNPDRSNVLIDVPQEESP